MALLKMDEIRKMKEDERSEKLKELKLELSKERANIEVGGSVKSPGRIGEIRKAIARIMTVTDVNPKGKKNGGA